MYIIKILESEIDGSVNIIRTVPEGGYFEARFVQRKEDTAVVYLSSQAGCHEACRFCHLTQTGQTQKTEAGMVDYLEQIGRVFDIINNKCDVSKLENIHFNFMARGDIMNNSTFLDDPQHFLLRLDKLSRSIYPKATPRFKLSTIFPNNDTPHLFIKTESVLALRHECDMDVEFYYSLYSLQEKFRKKWIPKALPPRVVGDIFKGTKEGLRLHHALIAGQNDSKQDVRLIHDWLEKYDLEVMFNLVRYNPFDDGSGTESSDFVRSQYMDWMRESPRVKLAREISLVGKDVKASCGMFVS